jgi:hypothetical protein
MAPFMRSRHAEQPASALHKRPTGSLHRQSDAIRSQFLETRQRAHINDRISADRNGQIVAAMLALDADPPGEKRPHCSLNELL